MLAAAGVLSLASCSNTDESAAPSNRITFNNFEALDGWGDPVPSLSTVQAHSGRYALKVDKDVEYSLSYTNLLGKASATKVKKLIVHGWVYVGGANATAALVIQLTAPDKNNQQLFWEGIDLRQEAAKINEWREIRKELTLPENAEASQQLKVYMWRRGSEQPTYLDDLEILRGE